MTIEGKTRQIGSGKNWHFVNGDWKDGEDGLLEVSGMPEPPHNQEALYYAFNTQHAYKDVRVSFEFMLTPHSDVGPRPEKMAGLAYQVPVNLSDGSMLVFIHGLHDLIDEDLPIGVWGARHCRAYCIRSTDDGRTWSSPPVSVDNSARFGASDLKWDRWSRWNRMWCCMFTRPQS